LGVFFARPQPDLLPQEKEQRLRDPGFMDDRPANPVIGFSKTRRTILPLLEERAGARGRSLKQIPFANAGLICFRLVALPHVPTAGVSFSGQTFLTGAKSKL
jgi:hypothetical protein